MITIICNHYKSTEYLTTISVSVWLINKFSLLPTSHNSIKHKLPTSNALIAKLITCKQFRTAGLK